MPYQIRMKVGRVPTILTLIFLLAVRFRQMLNQLAMSIKLPILALRVRAFKIGARMNGSIMGQGLPTGFEREITTLDGFFQHGVHPEVMAVQVFVLN